MIAVNRRIRVSSFGVSPVGTGRSLLGGAEPEDPEESDELDPLLVKFANSWPIRFSSTIADCVKSI